MTPGLDHDPRVVEIDREDPPQPREHDQHALGDRQRAARRGPVPAPRATHGTPAS